MEKEEFHIDALKLKEQVQTLHEEFKDGFDVKKFRQGFIKEYLEDPQNPLYEPFNMEEYIKETEAMED